MLKLEQIDHPLRRRAQAGIGRPEQAGQAGADMLLPGQDQVLPDG